MRSEVQVFPGPPIPGIRCQVSGTVLDYLSLISDGAIAQLGERLLCKQEVVGSIPSGSTSLDLEAKISINQLHEFFSSAEKMYPLP